MPLKGQPAMFEGSRAHGQAGELACPVCHFAEQARLYPDYSGRCITSQMFYIDDIELDNRCCLKCGFIFNMKGIRGREEEVYNRRVWKPKPQVISFSNNVMNSHQRALQVFERIFAIPEEGALLDFGAGTGSFLKEFHNNHPKWELTAIEPGDGFRQLVEKVPLNDAYNAPYYSIEIENRFEMVVVMSVLEHIADPLGALNWIHRALKPGGTLLMQHPNFALLPGDLFCSDHINKLTPQYTRQLCEAVGFEAVAEDAMMAPFYQAYSRRGKPLRPLPNLSADSHQVAVKCEHIARQTILSVEAAVDHAKSNMNRAAVFGTSPIGSMAHLILGCKHDIACFVDENQNMWDHEIDGIPVIGPDRMKEFGVSDIGIAISPLYWEKVAEKMRGFGVRPHHPRTTHPSTG